MNKNKLREITPKEWGLLVYLSEDGIVDLDRVKTAMKNIAMERIAFAEENLDFAKDLMQVNPTNRFIINRAYYCMYHSARAAVYVQMQLDVEKHQALIEKFKKLVIREFNDKTLADWMDNWRVKRNECDYNPLESANADLCNIAVRHGELILNTCKNLVEAL